LALGLFFSFLILYTVGRTNGKKGIWLWKEGFTCELKWQRDCYKYVVRCQDTTS
jgi:hypothetical protein